MKQVYCLFGYSYILSEIFITLYDVVYTPNMTTPHHAVAPIKLEISVSMVTCTCICIQLA